MNVNFVKQGLTGVKADTGPEKRHWIPETSQLYVMSQKWMIRLRE